MANRNASSQSPLVETIDEEYHRYHHQHEANQDPGNCVYAFRKIGFHCFSRDRHRHGAEKGIITYGYHDRRCTPADDIASHKGDVRVICDGIVFLLTDNRNLFDGIALPVRADWLINRSLASSTRTSAGTISPAEMNNITDYQIFQRDPASRCSFL